MGVVLPGSQANVSWVLHERRRFGQRLRPFHCVQPSRVDSGVTDMGIGVWPGYPGYMRDLAGSWLSGPTSSGSGPEQKFKGENLGMPAHGAGSMAQLGTRFGALIIDWLLAYALVGIVVTLAGPGALGGESFSGVVSWAVPAVWGVIGVICVWLFAQTPGQAILGIGTARIDADERVGFVRSLIRVIFIFFLIPPLVQDEDGRGMHDRATGTALIRTR